MSISSIEEFLDKQLETRKKDLDNVLKRLSAKQKKVKDSFKIGDVSGLKDALTDLLGELSPSQEIFQEVKSNCEDYNLTDYLKEGFDDSFRKAMADEGLPLRGEFPSYEVFPLMVRILTNDGQVIINKKRTKALRLKALVNAIKIERDKFFKSSFKTDEFLKDLAAAYDKMMELKQLKARTPLNPQAIPILDIYNALTPMRRWRRDYTSQLFGFHLYRLLKAEEENPENTILHEENGGRRCITGSGAFGSRKVISIVEENGRETAFGSIKFVEIEA